MRWSGTSGILTLFKTGGEKSSYVGVEFALWLYYCFTTFLYRLSYGCTIILLYRFLDAPMFLLLYRFLDAPMFLLCRGWRRGCSGGGGVENTTDVAADAVATGTGNRRKRVDLTPEAEVTQESKN